LNFFWRKIMAMTGRLRATFYAVNTAVGKNIIFARTSLPFEGSIVLPPEQPVFVLVHGLLISSRYMMPTAERLAIDYPVLVPDLLGFGQSSDPPYVPMLAELADTLVQWLNAINLRRPIFLGNSLGCQVLTDLAVRYPTRVERLILTGPTLDPQASSLVAHFLRLLADWPRERLSLSLPLVRDIFAGGLLRALQTFRYALHDPIRQKLAQLQTPTLVVRGDRDPIAPQRWVEEMIQLIPHGRLAVIRGAPHAVTYSAPDALASVVNTFVANQ
jgi:2-hydroxy-6-oxonona-2,4-dienedioate hydrolase